MDEDSVNSDGIKLIPITLKTLSQSETMLLAECNLNKEQKH